MCEFSGIGLGALIVFRTQYIQCIQIIQYNIHNMRAQSEVFESRGTMCECEAANARRAGDRIWAVTLGFRLH